MSFIMYLALGVRVRRLPLVTPPTPLADDFYSSQILSRTIRRVHLVCARRYEAGVLGYRVAPCGTLGYAQSRPLNVQYLGPRDT